MMKPKRPGYGGGGFDFNTPSNNLWVGNLPVDVTESELMNLFNKHGFIDGVTCYPSRSYAFIYYKRVEDAASAKEALQGFLIKGNPIKIEFAKPANPSKHVWVGGFGSSVTKEKLEEELSKFGKIEEFKFIRDRNTALVDFVRVEDASAAVKNLNGLRIGGDRIRVDFLRSHPSRREQSDFHDMVSAQFRGMGGIDPSWTNPDIMRNYPEPTYSGHKRPQPSQPFGGRKAGQTPSKVLWVGYPPSLVIDEEMLHNAMILYGEIERIKCFPARHYSFVEFRSVEEARRAKEGLQGRFFNDPRITIMYSNSDVAPGKDFVPPYPGYRGEVSDIFGTEVPFRPPLMDVFPPNLCMGPNSFPGPPPPNGLLGPGLPRPFVPRGGLEPHLPSDFNDQMSDLTAHAHLGLNRRKLSPPASGLLPTPGAPGRTSHKTSGWDVLDPNQLPRELKRSRIDGQALFNDRPFNIGKRDEYVAGVDQPYGADPQFIGGSLPRGHPDSGLSPADMGVMKCPPRAEEDFIWRGVIAKGGTPVCHARCIPIGKGLECALPDVVNCSARTGLDMLTKHYAGATGYDIVFFLPDSEDDFSNYTEFLRYLGSKDRAGVAKLDDGTTLFLVPPSDFLKDVLKVAGPERLYGVVLKLPQQLAGGATAPQPPHQPLPPIQHMESQLPPPAHEYVAPVAKKESAFQMDYGRAVPPETTLPPKAPFPPGFVSQYPSNDSIPSTSHPGVTLTPELIATLATLLPANAQAPVGQSAQPQLSQGWSQQPQMLDPTEQSLSQFSSQLYPNTQVSTTFQPFSASFDISSNHPVPVLPENMPTQNPVYNLQDQSRGPSILPVTTQNQQFVPSTQVTHPFHFDAVSDTRRGYGVMHGTHTGSYGVANIEQPNQPASYMNQFHGADLSRTENVLPSSTGNTNVEPLNQAERLQPMSSGVASQGTGEVEVDKNQRYQSTLQFAANLLFQIQQKQQQQQQQASSHMGNQQ